jgi:nitrogen fixation-related uncharacterized protein
MFVPIWLIFFISGTVMAIFTVAWSIKTRQFDDQDRAKYLPLAGLSSDELKERSPIRTGADFVAMMTILFLGFSVMISCLVIVLRHS